MLHCQRREAAVLPSYHRADRQDIESSVTTSTQTLSVESRGNYYHTHCWCGNRDQYVTNCTYCWLGIETSMLPIAHIVGWKQRPVRYQLHILLAGNRDQYVTNCTYYWLETETSTLPIAYIIGCEQRPVRYQFATEIVGREQGAVLSS